ncbi:Hypothetical protein R9X50_00305400 [Acrodontium crateriforme]|uniref:UBC core domain-containing protein n=1 Tax=Acrodontium crateriforme TaxID=150365 RepID=A0AAQ3R3Y7_9PEZI|nr:Hypothetical protein R9X50_00305400 [Acrodontium crateriforme]
MGSSRVRREPLILNRRLFSANLMWDTGDGRFTHHPSPRPRTTPRTVQSSAVTVTCLFHYVCHQQAVPGHRPPPTSDSSRDMSFSSAALTRQQLRIDFATLKFACPKGVYVAPTPDEPLQWSGVLFLRKGPYANAVLRFTIKFPDNFPTRPPVISFLSDVFHPLVTPLTTYTYSTRDTGTETVSAADQHRLPPGGLSLRHGFPEWFNNATERTSSPAAQRQQVSMVTDGDESSAVTSLTETSASSQPPHVVEILQYLRVVFDTEEVLDSIPLDAAANSGAWHAWRSYRSKITSRTASPVPQSSDTTEATLEQSTSPRKQPGGARRPGEWNWQGVWEDRVKKSVQASISEPMLFGSDSSEVIGFLKMDPEMLEKIKSEQITA